MNYKIIYPETKTDFEHYYYLRWKLLRKPLKKELGSEKDSMENSSMHRIVVDVTNNDFIAVGRLHHNDKNESQIRYFAVDRSYRRKGVGAYLMNDLENLAKNSNRSKIILNARENAVMFYKKLGYKVIKKTYLLYNKIQHFEMKKVL